MQLKLGSQLSNCLILRYTTCQVDDLPGVSGALAQFGSRHYDAAFSFDNHICIAACLYNGMIGLLGVSGALARRYQYHICIAACLHNGLHIFTSSQGHDQCHQLAWLIMHFPVATYKVE